RTEKISCPSFNNIIFQINNACNAKCMHCFLKNELNKNVGRELSLDEIKRFFRKLGHIGNIVLGGGEPFLRDDLPDICRFLAEYNTPALITIPTNASLPDKIAAMVKRILDTTADCGVKISISLDGMDAVHDRIRGIDGLFSRVGKLYSNLEYFAGIYLPRLEIQINTALFKYNLNEFKKIYEYVRDEMPVAEFTFETIRGHFDKKNAEPISNDEYREIIGWVKAQGYKKGGLHETMLLTEIARKQLYPCIAGTDFVVLKYNGDLGVCEILEPVVNIREYGYDFELIKKSPAWHKAVSFASSGSCYCSHSCFLEVSMNKCGCGKTAQSSSPAT
ncbi:MAG: radical SAM protein, partial [Candidatus Omnitrophica bacterium]|nr:radical SAM protein [Candidatus Omnitrophota bacterium]